MITSKRRSKAFVKAFLASTITLYAGCVLDTTTYYLSDSKEDAKNDGLLIASYTPYSSLDSLLLTEAWVQKGYHNNKDGSREIGDEFELCFNIASESSSFFSNQNFHKEHGFSFQHKDYSGGITKGVYNYGIDKSLPDSVTITIYRGSPGLEKFEIGKILFVKDK